jgi:hypothetical protein
MDEMQLKPTIRIESSNRSGALSNNCRRALPNKSPRRTPSGYSCDPSWRCDREGTRCAYSTTTCERPRVLEVARRKALHFGEGGVEVSTEAVNDTRSPPLLLLPHKDVAPDAPVEEHELGVDLQCCLDLGRADARLQTVEKGSVPAGNAVPARATARVGGPFFPVTRVLLSLLARRALRAHATTPSEQRIRNAKSRTRELRVSGSRRPPEQSAGGYSTDGPLALNRTVSTTPDEDARDHRAT